MSEILLSSLVIVAIANVCARWWLLDD